MNKLSIILILISTILTVGCATTTTTRRQVTAKSADVVYSGVVQRPLVVDLNVSETRVRGTFTGTSTTNTNLQTLKDLAIENALSTVNADILLEPRFNVTTNTTGEFTEIIVVVTGYPATYRNFRNFNASDTAWINLRPANRLSVTQRAETPTTTSPPQRDTQRQTASAPSMYFDIGTGIGSGAEWGARIGRGTNRWIVALDYSGFVFKGSRLANLTGIGLIYYPNPGFQTSLSIGTGFGFSMALDTGASQSHGLLVGLKGSVGISSSNGGGGGFGGIFARYRFQNRM